MTNPYVEALHRALPRLLASYNADPTSPLGGVGDRFHWAWKLIDFPNGSFQGALHGLALLTCHKLLPAYLGEDDALARVRSMLTGLKSITARNGSLDEALPHEASYCVTALVAADVLAARELLCERLTADERDEWLRTVRPLVDFLMRQDEHHALISNHLASGALAMFRWHAASGESRAETRGQLWLDRILQHQSAEGWFSEYGGADPGYQSWCTTQLAQLHRLRPDLGLAEALAKSLGFLRYAAHPDGSFGGVYGSRNTRFLLPGGVELLAGQDPNAGALAAFARNSIDGLHCVTLDCIDAGNLVPFFNDYALAAAAAQQNQTPPIENGLPCFDDDGRSWFPDAGWLVDSGSAHYSIINLKRGGAAVHFSKNRIRIDDPGMVARDERGQIVSTQLSAAEEIPDNLSVAGELSLRFALRPAKRPLPSAFDFMVLRLFCVTLFKSLLLGNLIKKLLARLLVSSKTGVVGYVVRKYRLGENFAITSEFDRTQNFRPVADSRHFSAIHMASQGYWQHNDGHAGSDS